MPSPSPGKCRGSVVRQLSLQNQTPLQSPSNHRKLKKQLSEDDSRLLVAVEVTGQGWPVGNERPESILRIGSGDGKIGQAKITGTRPKPVKVAWADRRQESLDCPAGVEIVATKCQGQPRPISVKAQRLKNPLLGNKDTLVYTRLQLAERLRNAWSEREKIKPNLNIFLAHGSETTRSENNDLTTGKTPGNAAHQDSISSLSDSSAPLDKKRKSMQVRAFSHDLYHSGGGSTPNLYEVKLQENYITSKPELITKKKEKCSQIEANKNSPKNENKTLEDTGRYLQELNKIEIRVTKIEHLSDNQENEHNTPEDSSSNLENVVNFKDDDSPLSVKRSRNKENLGSNQSLTSISNNVEPSEQPVLKERNQGIENKEVVRPTAQDRRANFRRSSILQKTITESFSSRLPKEEEKEKVSEAGDDFKVILKPTLKKPPLVRAFSAPSQTNEPSSEPQKSSSQQKKVRIAPQRKLQPTVSFDIPSTTNEDITALRERIKSAPVRRKLKSAATRRKSKEKDSSDEEKETKESTSSKKVTKRSQMKNASDIVTMVSLVSPAASDTEESVINLPLESWRDDEKEEQEQSTKSTSNSIEETKDSSSLDIQKFVSLRKTTKSVSFQPHPVLNRSYSASFPSRRVPAGTPIIVPTPVINNPALTPAQILERDKRAAVFSSINSGTDGRGIKRRLLRSSTEPTKEEDSFDESNKLNVESENPVESSEKSTKDEENEAEEKSNGEPEFKSSKEKECWNLYQKMVAKGVSVSFDTVLRGMLTPTEYRLRKNSLLSTC